MQATWFVAYQTFTPETAIRLGQLITDPRKPEERLDSTPLAIDAKERVFSGPTKHDVLYEKEINKDSGLGFSATVLSFLPFSIGGDKGTGTTHRFQIKKVEEKFFDPSADYVHKSVLQPAVLGYLAKNGYRKSLYMIVGIRTGHDATIEHGKSSKVGGNVNISISGAPIGVPVDVGANATISRDNKVQEHLSIPNEFVFAYRLREVRYFKNKQSVVTTLHTKQADLHDLNAPKVAPKIKEATQSFHGTADEIVVEGIAAKDLIITRGEGIKVIDGCVMVS